MPSEKIHGAHIITKRVKMQTRIKKLIQQGKLEELTLIFKNKDNSPRLIEAITMDDFAILTRNHLSPDWEYAGVGTSMEQPFNPNYRYEMDINDKLVVRYQRVPAIDAWEKCFSFVNEMRSKVGLKSLKEITLEKYGSIHKVTHILRTTQNEKNGKRIVPSDTEDYLELESKSDLIGQQDESKLEESLDPEVIKRREVARAFPISSIDAEEDSGPDRNTSILQLFRPPPIDFDMTLWPSSFNREKPFWPSAKDLKIFEKLRNDNPIFIYHENRLRKMYGIKEEKPLKDDFGNTLKGTQLDGYFNRTSKKPKASPTFFKAESSQIESDKTKLETHVPGYSS